MNLFEVIFFAVNAFVAYEASRETYLHWGLLGAILVLPLAFLACIGFWVTLKLFGLQDSKSKTGKRK
jgi:hypothetical protein